MKSFYILPLRNISKLEQTIQNEKITRRMEVKKVVNEATTIESKEKSSEELLFEVDTVKEESSEEKNASEKKQDCVCLSQYLKDQEKTKEENEEVLLASAKQISKQMEEEFEKELMA